MRRLGLLVSGFSLLGGRFIARFGVVASARPGPEMAEGLRLFSTPDSQGRACSTCHSPDGIELAAFNSDRATIVRRATPHLGSDDAERIADYLLEMRRKLPGKVYDPMQDRPLQPGGKLLPGETPKQRDEELARELPRLIPVLLGPAIDSREQASRRVRSTSRPIPR